MSFEIGKKRKILSWVKGNEPRQSGRKWYRKALLECGHMEWVSVGYSPNHYRLGSPEEPRIGRCILCFRKEAGLE